MADLMLEWWSDDDPYGTLHVEVAADRFAGHGHAWFEKNQLKTAFVAPLKAYPLRADAAAVVLEGGAHFGGRSRHSSVRITVMPHDRRGNLLVLAVVSTDVETDPNRDLQQAATVRFVVEYEALARFAAELDAALDRGQGEAVLRGSTSGSQVAISL